MLFTWDTTNLCIVFRQWHIRSTTSLIFSLLAVILLAVGYEALRSLSRRYEDSLAKHVQTMPSESSSFPRGTALPKKENNHLPSFGFLGVIAKSCP